MDQSKVSQFWLTDGVEEKLQYLQEQALHSFPTESGFEFYDNQNQKVMKLIVPIVFPQVAESSFAAYVQGLPPAADDIIVVLIQAGEACLGRVLGNELVTHKLIRKYMVRKSQGKAQIQHLKTKGKSRAGSRIRLAQTVKFFEEINEHLTLWFEEEKPDRVAYHIPTTMKSLWYESKVPPPFKKEDPLLRKTYWDVQKPRREEIIRSIRRMNWARITIFDPELRDDLIPILEKND